MPIFGAEQVDGYASSEAFPDPFVDIDVSISGPGSISIGPNLMAQCGIVVFDIEEFGGIPGVFPMTVHFDRVGGGWSCTAPLLVTVT